MCCEAIPRVGKAHPEPARDMVGAEKTYEQVEWYDGEYRTRGKKTEHRVRNAREDRGNPEEENARCKCPTLRPYVLPCSNHSN